MYLPRPFRALPILLLAILLVVGLAQPASAQLPDLPVAPEGVVGPVLDPLEEVVETITGPLGDSLGDLPLDNAVRLLGTDAVEAAIALSRITFETSQIALIGRDDVFADTLSSVSTQGIAGAPLLLTQTNGMDSRTVEEMERLGVSEVIILGSILAISEAVEAELVATYGADNVSRLGGPSRVETAALLAEHVAPQTEHVVLLRAYNDPGTDQAQAYADALSVGPFASRMEYPALLTTTDYLHPATAAYLDDAGVSRVTIVGGEAAIGAPVADTLTQMGMTVDRINGQNRWDTSVLIARAAGFDDAADASRLILTEGGALAEPLWAAGFAAAAHGAVFEAPVILADGAFLPPETLGFIGDGLLSNALRLSNLPVICNSFVDFLACETVALLFLGPLDEVNALTGGALEAALGPLFGPLAEALDGTIPPPGEGSPGLIGQILSLIGLSGDEEMPPADECSDGIDNDEDGTIDESDECEAAFAAAMATQPLSVQGALTRMMGPAGQRISASRQAVLIGILANLNDALSGPVLTSVPEQAAALVVILDAITATLDSRSATLPIDGLTDLLAGIDALGLDGVGLAALADLVVDLGIDAPPTVEALTDTVSDLLGATSFSDSRTLTDTYGVAAQPLADAVDALRS